VTELNGAAASGGVALLVNRAHMSQADATPSLLLGKAIEVEHTLAKAAKALSVFIDILRMGLGLRRWFSGLGWCLAGFVHCVCVLSGKKYIASTPCANRNT